MFRYSANFEFCRENLQSYRYGVAEMAFSDGKKNFKIFMKRFFYRIHSQSKMLYYIQHLLENRPALRWYAQSNIIYEIQ
jgi:hypothetical protein